MPTPKRGPRLGGSASHQRKIMSNLATQLIENGSITTTEAKAKFLRPYFEKLVTKAKSGTIHDRRVVSRKIHSKDAVYELFDVIAPQIDDERNGGYTRITKIGYRKGDNAPMAVIEIITEPVVKKATVKAAEAPAKKAAKKVKEEATPVEETVVVETAAEEGAPEELEADAVESSESSETGPEAPAASIDADADAAEEAK